MTEPLWQDSEQKTQWQVAKEHMALLSALTGLGVGMRFIVAADSDIKEI